MLRPGRLGKLLYVPLPSAEDRLSILRAVSKKVTLDEVSEDRVDLAKIAADSRADGFSGADMAALVREAGLAVVREWREQQKLLPSGDVPENDVDHAIKTEICARHFEAAFAKVRSSVSLQDRKR